MSKHKDEKHRNHGHSGQWSMGNDDHPPESPGPAETPIELSSDRVAETQSEANALKEQISSKDKEIAELKDKYLRALADTENVRKRMRQQGEETARLQRERLLRDLLPITDRGGGNGKPIVEGVEMVLRSLLDFLRSNNVTPRDSIGQPFDPQFHEAVDHVESAKHPPNTVISEFHRGYQVGERVLRPARVAVAKPPSSESGSAGGGEGGD
jgi:molecular chaperone GrpE